MRVRRRVDWSWDEFIPSVWIRAAFGSDGAKQCIKEEERPRNLPAARVPCGSASPGVRRESSARFGDQVGDIGDDSNVDAGLLRGELEGVVFV